MGFGEFFDSLNIILDYCQYSKLYIKNQFDWLILKSIWEIENNYETTEGNSPLEFFNDVLDSITKRYGIILLIRMG